MMSRPLIYEFYQYSQNGQSPVVSPASGKTIELYDIRMYNRSGSSGLAALLQKMSSSNVSIFSYVGGVASEESSGFDVFTTTNSEGFIVQSDDKFGVIGMVVSAGEAGSPVYSYEYYDGSSWQTLSTVQVPAAYSTGEKHVVFAAPVAWVRGSPAITGLGSNKYSIRVTAPTAPSSAVTVSSIFAAKIVDMQPSLGSGSSFQSVFSPEDPLKFEAEEGVLPFFGTASANNLVSVTYRLIG